MATDLERLSQEMRDLKNRLQGLEGTLAYVNSAIASIRQEP
ncbi:MAG: hypothetical protein NT031_18740 [Planctomycetota bacterium]|nr:hypothetical protein [Planctomycetota bacterium]